MQRLLILKEKKMANRAAMISANSQDECLDIRLPLTNPTGKIRVKCRNDSSEFGKPFYTRRQSIEYSCYMEWQISYDTEDKDKNGVVSNINFLRKGKKKYGYELSSVYYLGLKENIFPVESIDMLLDYAKQFDDNDYIENRFNISRKEVGQIQLKDLKFQKI